MEKNKKSTDLVFLSVEIKQDLGYLIFSSVHYPHALFTLIPWLKTNPNLRRGNLFPSLFIFDIC